MNSSASTVIRELPHGNELDFSRLSVIIPTKNEAHNIGKLLHILHKNYHGIQTIVVDDDSVDGTFNIVKQFSKTKLISRTNAQVQGLTISVLEGIYACDTEYFVVIDGDFQHPPESIAEMYEHLSQGLDLVIATRYRNINGWPFSRQCISLVATFLAKQILKLHKLQISDPLSGFFGGRTAYLQASLPEQCHRFELKGYKILFDILKTSEKNIRYKEVYYSFNKRVNGQSKFGIAHAFYFFRALLR
jgi:dolichol-phosphate mannosyltransferase